MQAATPTPSRPRNYAVSIAIIGVLFFIFGFVTWLNGTLIPFLQLACDLKSDGQALLVTFAFYMSYFFLAIPSSFILRKTGLKGGMSLGLMVMAVGALVFIPAALMRSFEVFLAGLFVQGMGLALLQTASNPYISVIGPIESAASRISIMGICNKVAGVLSPIVLSALVLSNARETEAAVQAAASGSERDLLLQELAHRIVAPYGVMAAALIVLGLMIRYSPLPEIDGADEDGERAADGTRKTSILQFPHLLLGVVCIFVYVGVEVMAGDVISLYGKALGLNLDRTKILTTYTMVSMLVGYSIGIVAIPRYLRQETALKLSAITGIAFALAAYFAPGTVSIVFIALLGLANALMWPAIFPMAIDGLGRFTSIGSALLVMGIAGGAILPQIYARLAASIGHQSAFFWCVLPCYLFILYFAVSGHRVGRRSA